MAHPLIGLVQLLLLSGFVCAVVYLNVQRPAGMHYRPFRILWWAPTVCGAMVILGLAILLHIPHHLQHTNVLVQQRHEQGRAQCLELMERGALHDERAALFAKEFFKDEATAPTHSKKTSASTMTVASLLRPLLNALLFNSGVTICAIPLLLYLGILHLRRRATATSQEVWVDVLRRESGVLLPVLNFISLVSAFTAPTFYLFIQPGRVDRCIYTSGHWFTFSVTVLTFSVIIAHLVSYQKYCRSSGRLLGLFIGWAAVYTMCALSVLKRTQEAFHDSVEAVDGIRQALPAFPVYMILFIALQYITFITTDSDGEREREPQVAHPASSQSTLPATPIPPLDTMQKERPSAAVASAIPSPVKAIPEAPSMSDIPDAPPPPPPPAPSMARAAPPAPQLTSRNPKTAAPPPPAPSDPRSALLGDISAGKAHLRPVRARETRPPTAASGLEKWIADARKVLQPDGEDTQEEKWE